MAQIASIGPPARAQGTKKTSSRRTAKGDAAPSKVHPIHSGLTDVTVHKEPSPRRKHASFQMKSATLYAATEKIEEHLKSAAEFVKTMKSILGTTQPGNLSDKTELLVEKIDHIAQFDKNLEEVIDEFQDYRTALKDVRIEYESASNTGDGKNKDHPKPPTKSDAEKIARTVIPDPFDQEMEKIQNNLPPDIAEHLLY